MSDDQYVSTKCPIGLDSNPSLCSAGTCAICRDIRDENRSQEWRTMYLGIPWTDTFDIGDDCEYCEARGGREWVAARVLDFLIEDRVYYVIEYVDHLGRLCDRKVRRAELRKPKKKGLDTQAQDSDNTVI